MENISYIRDKTFLKQLDLTTLKTYFVKIHVLDEYELLMDSIEGRVSSGNISINGNSSIRRSGNLTMVADEGKNDITNIDSILSMNKRIQIFIGIENAIDKNYDDIIWFNQGVYLITALNISHTTSGVSISISFKDKMCLLNGELGGNLPAAVTLDSYNQAIDFLDCGSTFPTDQNNYTIYKVNDKYYLWNDYDFEEVSAKQYSDYKKDGFLSVKQRIFDIVQTLVCNYGGESNSKIIINDIPLQIKANAKNGCSSPVYFNKNYQNPRYTLQDMSKDKSYVGYEKEEFFGYKYEDFVFGGELTTSPGESVCSALDKIKNYLGNFEYFYDVNGNFVMQEIKNYLNMQYDPVQTVDKTSTLKTVGAVLDDDNYYMDRTTNSDTIYTFEEGSTLITSYTNAPDYTSVKNDFQVWGDSKHNNIHYHLAIKEKPQPPYEKRIVIFYKDSEGNYDGRMRLPYEDDYISADTNIRNGILYYNGISQYQDTTISLDKNEAVINEDTLEINILKPSIISDYEPSDWRVEVYLRGLEKRQEHLRPDMYEEEIIDLLPSIYDFTIYNPETKTYGAPKSSNVNDLNYWVDYINPIPLQNISVDSIGSKTKAYKQDNIVRIFNPKIPDVVILNSKLPTKVLEKLKADMAKQKQSYVVLTDGDSKIYEQCNVVDGGYAAEDVARELLYQGIDMTSSITINSIPIYYLDVNTRIEVYDESSNIYGDYVINSINLPLDAQSTMSISATKVLTRI